MLAAVHGSGRMQLDYRGLIERAGSARVVRSTLRWWDLERYTDRQDTKLRVGGLIGEVEYEGRVIEEFMPLIPFELLHKLLDDTFHHQSPLHGSKVPCTMPPSWMSE